MQSPCFICRMDVYVSDATPTPSTYWWDAFESFYFGGTYFPFGLSLLCLIYGLWILFLLYLISFRSQCRFGLPSLTSPPRHSHVDSCQDCEPVPPRRGTAHKVHLLLSIEWSHPSLSGEVGSFFLQFTLGTAPRTISSKSMN